MNRSSLYNCLDNFLTALLSHRPQDAGLHPKYRYSENNVMLEAGDGIWNTVTGRGDYDFRFADVHSGQVCLFTTLEETSDISAATIRLKVEAEGISEAELLIVRDKDEALTFENPVFESKAVMNACLDPSEQSGRERMIEIANGYFETLEKNDGVLHTCFHPDCNRVENGVQTTNNPDFFVPVARLGCEAQFKLGYYRYDDRLRGRRFPLIDQDRGLVLAGGFIDHCGIVSDYELTDGTQVSSPIRRPHTFYLLEAFKIRAGMIEQIEANFITVPYHMPSPWDA